jgi:hypothetical protein
VSATEAQAGQLARPTPHDRVQWRGDRATRDGSRIAVLAYVDARYVMETLDEVVGPGNWQDRYEDAIGGYRGGIGVNVDGEWIWKYDAAPASDIEGIKGGHSDAMKRAGVKWGIGRDLYDYPDLWVPAEETYSGSGKYRPAALPVWNGSTWISPAPTNGTGRASPPARPAAAPARTSTAVPDEPEFPDDFGEPTPIRKPTNGTGGWTFKQLAEAAEAKGIAKNAIYQQADSLFGKGTKVTDLTPAQREQIAFEMGL